MPRITRKNKKYSNEFRKKAVEAYLRGEGSLVTLSKRFGIVHKETLREWVLWYNGHKEFKERSSAKGEIYMTKGRKTTQEERAEIVAFCIEHNKDYGLTVETYNAPMEGWWGILKSEMYYLKKFTSRDSLVSAIEDYIHFYNTRRYQKHLNCMTPCEYFLATAA